eukprot:CAMPEP_0183709370 /NCGR_PEP_ID=MMETSP0737-20130205/5425_1 /TAXON_ID=385413 /ORGANISM="Thalassiosira miniscula, Strain CCMP1093" /LENGTH=655 /DNA_ID=CAMNT_0025937449 /DNA_START=217 /DNA_END=2184 /DNA_ORIENTATION=+
MVSKIKIGIKQRHRRPKEKEMAAHDGDKISDGVDPILEDKVASSNDGAEHKSKTDTLVSQLREHVVQGRIFDARSIVQELNVLEKEDPSSSSSLEPVRHLMEEVLAQSDHVESLLHELHSDDDWTLAKEKSGVTVHYRREPSSPIHTVRAVTTFNNFSPKDFVRLCSLFVETECMHLWFPGGIMKKANLLSWHSKYSKVIQLRIKLGLPMISTRDAIVLGNGYHFPDRNAFMISTKTILEDTCRYCEIPKPEKGVVRMATNSIFYIQLLKSDVISFKMIGRDDLKLKYMPSSLLNYLAQGHLPLDLMRTVHRTIRNFKGSVWEKKIEERGAYYTEIEDKVHEQLDKWERDGGDGNREVPDLQIIAEEMSENRNVKSEESKSMKAKLIPTKDHSKDEEQKHFFVDSEDESQSSLGLFAFVTIVSTVFALVLYAIAFPETLPTATPTMIRDLSEVVRTNKQLLPIVVLLLILPIVILKTFRKREKQIVTDREQSTTTGNDEKGKPVVGSGYDEFLSFINEVNEEETSKDDMITDLKGETMGPNSPTSVLFINSDPQAPPGLDFFYEQDDNDQSGKAINLEPQRKLSDPRFPDSGEKKLTVEIPQSSVSPRSDSSSPTKSFRSSKMKKVRSTLNSSIKEIKKVASPRVLSGKRHAKNE